MTLPPGILGFRNQPSMPGAVWHDAGLEAFISPRLRYVPEPTLLLLAVLRDLVEDAGDRIRAVPPERIGIMVDTGDCFDGLQREFFMSLDKEGASPLLFPHTAASSAASLAAIQFQIKGPCAVIRGATGLAAFAEAHNCLIGGLADLMIVAALDWSVPCATAVLVDSALDLEAIKGSYREDSHPDGTGPCRWFSEWVRPRFI